MHHLLRDDVMMCKTCLIFTNFHLKLTKRCRHMHDHVSFFMYERHHDINLFLCIKTDHIILYTYTIGFTYYLLIYICIYLKWTRQPTSHATHTNLFHHLFGLNKLSLYWTYPVPLKTKSNISYMGYGWCYSMIASSETEATACVHQIDWNKMIF